jgi:hypothetical protein
VRIAGDSEIACHQHRFATRLVSLSAIRPLNAPRVQRSPARGWSLLIATAKCRDEGHLLWWQSAGQGCETRVLLSTAVVAAAKMIDNDDDEENDTAAIARWAGAR